LASKQVSLDGQVLHGHDRYGWWQVNKIEGWDETPPEKSTQSDVVNGHGAIAVPVYYGSRTVTITGRLIAKNHELAVDAKRMLAALLQESGDFVVFSDGGVALSARAFRGRITPGPVAGRWLTFDMELRFPDPFRYGAARTFSVALGTSVSVYQRGYFGAWPVLTVTGTAPGGYAVSLDGRLVRITAPLVSGSPHTLDMRTGVLRAGGSRVYSGIAEAEYFSIPPGSPSTFVTSINTTGSATVAISLNDTFI